jgi:hypothetical protein
VEDAGGDGVCGKFCACHEEIEEFEAEMGAANVEFWVMGEGGEDLSPDRGG